jgi:prepilin-type N-terminal cleavage/methylation domain-containing protein
MHTHARTVTPRRRHGFTLIEVLISMTLLLVIIVSVTTAYRSQIRAITKASGRFEAIQNLQFVQNAIDRELRLSGGVGGQPLIVMAHPMSLVFNVDLVTRRAGDASAVYYNPDADSLATEGFDPANARALPLVAKNYPAQIYRDGSGNASTSETIAYFLRRDMSASRDDIYTLYRRANARDSTVVARNIQVPGDSVYFFRYWRTNATGVLSEVPLNTLPQYWDGATRVADSIRVVDLRINSWFHDATTNADVIRGTSSSTKLLNAGLLNQSACGTAPLPARNIDTHVDSLDGSPALVRITWDASLEETTAEKDVALYLVQKRPFGGAVWETLSNVPANNSASYSYEDHALAQGSWEYAVVAQDCSPSNSGPLVSLTVVIP